MATRQELMQQIAALDKEINKEAASHRVPSLNTRYTRFPIASWVSAIVMFVLFVFADSFVPAEFDWADLVFLGLAILLALSALWSTIRWVLKKGQKTDKGYKAGTERLRMLQEQRQALQKQLNETK